MHWLLLAKRHYILLMVYIGQSTWNNKATIFIALSTLNTRVMLTRVYAQREDSYKAFDLVQNIIHNRGTWRYIYLCTRNIIFRYLCSYVISRHVFVISKALTCVRVLTWFRGHIWMKWEQVIEIARRRRRSRFGLVALIACCLWVPIIYVIYTGLLVIT